MVTRRIGALIVVVGALFFAYALVISPPDVAQGDSVRLFYIHVPSAVVCLYFAFGITALGSAIYLKNRSPFWDLLAYAAAEVGVVFCAFTLITGSLWGSVTWGSYWEWDPRLTSTLVTFILYVGYLAVRRMDLAPEVRSQRAAILGLLSFFNIIIVRYSVQWWRSLHQGVTLNPVDTQMDGDMLFSFFLGAVLLIMIFVWLMIHRFRVAWLETQAEGVGLEHAILERRREGIVGSASERASEAS